MRTKYQRKAAALTTEMIQAQLAQLTRSDLDDLLTESSEQRVLKEVLLRLSIANWSRCEKELAELKKENIA